MSASKPGNNVTSMVDRLALNPVNHSVSGPDVLLQVESLSIDFPLRTHTLHAVRDVNFQLSRGETLSLVGESGSGKSVCARALLRIIDPAGVVTGGRVMLAGTDSAVDVLAMKDNDRELLKIRGGRIGLVFQEPMSSLSPVHTIGSQLIEALRLHRQLNQRQAREVAIDLLAQVEIQNPETLIDRYAFEFSGGMRQRAMIAMALAGEPDVLIADEPTTALDVTTQAEILDLIKRLQAQRGMAMLLITHDMGIVAEVADRVAVMRYGRIIERGSVDDIFHQAQHPYTQQLLDSTLRLEQTPRQSSTKVTAVEHSAEPLLCVSNLCKSYGKRSWFSGKGSTVDALKDVSFELRSGETLGIVGESGSGKSTLGRSILNVIKPDSGSVRFRFSDGDVQEITTLDKAALKRFHREVRFIFQDPFASLNPRMTVRQIISDPLVVLRASSASTIDARVAELMTLVGLEPSAMERYPHAFSGGQRQRIGIARALALDPSIIIADEATAALDVSIRSQILDLLLDVQQKLGLSFLFISHDISVVRYFCDNVIVMHRGEIVERGTSEAICTQPQEPYTQSLISAVPNPDPRHKRMQARTHFNQNAPL